MSVGQFCMVTQLAVFNNERRGEWYCTQNMCPHKQAFVLSQGLIGEASGVMKVACPIHKKKFNLEDGAEIGGDLKLLSFPIKIEGDDVMVELPAPEEIDAILGTHGLRVRANECAEIVPDEDVKLVKFDDVMKNGQVMTEEVAANIRIDAEVDEESDEHHEMGRLRKWFKNHLGRKDKEAQPSS